MKSLSGLARVGWYKPMRRLGYRRGESWRGLRSTRLEVSATILGVPQVLLYLWVLPNTLVGLAWVLLARLTGGAWSAHTGVIEAQGGWVAPILQRLPFVRGGAAAITIGHVVLAQSQAQLDRTRTHERVHVRQYERWGPLFVFAYVLAGLWQWAHGKDPYRDNPFEVEAYDRCA